MKKFKRLSALALGVLLASSVALFACGPTPEPDPGDDPSIEDPNTPPDDPVTPPDDPIEPDDSVYQLRAQTKHCFLLMDDENYASAPTSFVSRKDGVAEENPKITYSIANPAVAAVDADGVVTPLSYGKTELIATYGNAEARIPVSVFEHTTADKVNSFDEHSVNVYGRTYFTGTKLNFDHVSSGIDVAFLGTSLTVDVDVTNDVEGSTSFDVYVHIYIDGDTEGTFTRLTQGTFTLAENLDEGIHTVRMLKASEIDRGKFTVNGFHADSFLRMPEKSGLKMEFIGDSITAGYGDLVTGGSWSVENSDACISYAALTGQKLDADFSVVALSGICLNTQMYGIVTMTQMHSYLSNRNPVPYTYDSDMDVVVLALGTNDASYIENKSLAYRNQFPKDYAEFLRHLRDIYPHAYVVCIYGMMGNNSFIDTGIKAALEDVNDAKMSYKTFQKNDSGANGHPNARAHATYSEQLVEYIQELIG